MGITMGFTKLDEGIIFSSLMNEDDSVFRVWIVLLATCKADGISPISEVFLQKITGKDEKEIDRCLNVLSNPDPKSRSKTGDGRRIYRLDGGFEIINYHKYRERSVSEYERERKRAQRDKNTKIANCPGQSRTVPGLSASASASASEYINCTKNKNIHYIHETAIERIYAIYPTVDVNNNRRNTSKTSKCKNKIFSVLRQRKYPLFKAVKWYVERCTQKGEYLKNFAVFLNNLPDRETLETWSKECREPLPKMKAFK